MAHAQLGISLALCEPCENPTHQPADQERDTGGAGRCHHRPYYCLLHASAYFLIGGFNEQKSVFVDAFSKFLPLQRAICSVGRKVTASRCIGLCLEFGAVQTAVAVLSE